MAETIGKKIDEKFCSECGAIIKVKAEICPKCGVRQSAPPFSSSLTAVTPNGKSKLAAALFAIFLGGLGIHKFYLGQTGWGILYLVFCWTFIPALVGLIEGILFLVMSDDEFNQKYGGSPTPSQISPNAIPSGMPIGEISLEQETKRCPACAETIKLEAIKCRHCGETLDHQEVARQVEERRAVLEANLARIKAGKIQCPRCQQWDVHRAYIEDGGQGDWCPNCGMSLQKMGKIS